MQRRLPVPDQALIWSAPPDKDEDLAARRDDLTSRQEADEGKAGLVNGQQFEDRCWVFDVLDRKRRVEQVAGSYFQRRYSSCSIPNWSRTLPATWSSKSSIVRGRW